MTLSDGLQRGILKCSRSYKTFPVNLKIQWWDIENLVFDAGQIVYKNPDFKNTLYLCTELGKPDYEFEEDGEERTGIFPGKTNISQNV